MLYKEYVNDIFVEDQDCRGVSMDEIQDMLEESTFEQREKWLLKQGYDLVNQYYWDILATSEED